MNTSSDTNMNVRLLTDALILLMFIIMAVLILQNFQAIENGISSVLVNSLNDINQSIAETSTGR